MCHDSQYTVTFIIVFESFTAENITLQRRKKAINKLFVCFCMVVTSNDLNNECKPGIAYPCV